jgi:hypothetical protein
MFNIAQFRKFDLLLLSNAMTHHRAGWEHAAGPAAGKSFSSMRLASRVPVLKRAGASGQRSRLGLDLRSV